MSSPFTMLSMLSKARRASAKRREAAASQESDPSTPATASSTLPIADATVSHSSSSTPSNVSTPPASTAPAAPSSIGGTESDFELSDSASIISVSSITGKKPKKKRSPSLLLRGLTLSRKSSVGSVLSQSQAQPQAGLAPPSAPAHVLSPILASPIDTEGSGFTHEPEGIEGLGQGLTKKASSDGFSVVSHGQGDEDAGATSKVGKDEGDWTEVAEAFPSAPASAPTPPPAAAPSVIQGEEPNSLSFNDAEELTSAEEELKKALAQVQALEGSLAEGELEKKRLAEEIRVARGEKARLEELLRSVEARLKDADDRGNDEQKEKERLGREILRVREENSNLSKSLQEQSERLKALEDRYAQQEVAKNQLQADLSKLSEEKDKLAAKARSDAEALRETKARFARQELEKGGVKAELQSVSREKESATLKLFSVTQQLDDTRREYEEEQAKVKRLEDEAERLNELTQRMNDDAKRLEEQKATVEGKVKRLEAELDQRTSEKEDSAVEAKEAGEELDHLYKRYAEQDDELNRLKEELNRAAAKSTDLAKVGQEAKRECGLLKVKMAEMERTWEGQRQRMVEAHASELGRVGEDVQAATAITEELLRTVRESKRENEGLGEKMREMKRAWVAESKRMVEEHAKSTQQLTQEERQRAAAERRSLIEEHESQMRLLKEDGEEVTANLAREMVAAKTRLIEEHAKVVTDLKEDLKEATWEFDIQTTTMAEDHKLVKKRWEDEKKALKAEWDNERSVWAREREEVSSAHKRLSLLLEKEKADRKEDALSMKAKWEDRQRVMDQERLEAAGDYHDLSLMLDKEKADRREDTKRAQEEMERIGNEIIEKANGRLKDQDSKIAGLEKDLKRIREERSTLKSWKSKAQAEVAEAGRLRKVVDKMSNATGSIDRVFEDQAKRQTTSDIRFTHPSTSRRRSNSTVEAVEPVDAAVSVLYSLNSEIFQAAASLADAVESETLPAAAIKTSNDEFKVLVAKVAPFLSEDLVSSLRASYTESPDGANPLVLQVAFQACLAYGCNRFITSWYPLHWDYGRFLEVLHGRLVDAGTVPEADTWRSTTRALLRLTSDSHPQMVSYLRDSVLDIFSIIGRPISGRATEAMLGQFEEKFSVIARLAIRMHILFNDAPSNLETFLATPRALFRDDRMEDMYAEDEDVLYTEDANLRKVICTSEIGLQRLAGRNGAGEHVIAKPKVILAAILNQDW